MVVMAQQREQFRGRRNQPHRGLRGRRSSHVSNKLDDRRVRLVPDRGNERDRTGKRSVGDEALVEGPEILDRSSASGDKDGIDAETLVVGIDQADRAGDLLRGAFTLHANIDDHEADGGAATPRRVEHIVNRRAASGRDHRDSPRQQRQRALARFLEIAKHAKLFAHRAELQLQRPGADRLQRCHVQLGSTLRREVAHVAGGDHFVAVLRPERELLRVGRPRDAMQDGAGILQREVPVAVSPEIADLTNDPQRGRDARFQGALDQVAGLGDGELRRLDRREWPLFAARGSSLIRRRTGSVLRIERQALHARGSYGERSAISWCTLMPRAAESAPAAVLMLTTDIADVPGVGRRSAALRRLGIRCVADLILHLPQRYEHELPEQSVADAGEAVGPLHGATANVAVRGEIATSRLVRSKRSRFEATLQDGTATVLLTWFNSPWMSKKLHPGMNIRAWGKATRYGDYLQIVNPQWADLTGESTEAAGGDIAPREERLRPIYPASDSLPSSVIEQLINDALEPALMQLDDHLHEEYRRERALPKLSDAYRMVHRPRSQEEIDDGRRRLAFDDLLFLQLAVFLKREHRRETLRAPALQHGDAIDRHIRARIPFTLTAAQDAVLVDITRDLKRAAPMNRLLQGDVGSGKTAVALYAMLMAVASNHQAALMAPTELLAEQHFASLSSMLEGATVSIELLTGSLPAASRREIHRRLQAGDIDVLVGTHALLTKSVKFKSLAVAVIDEQHRFGVHQRAHLRAKAADQTSSPHVLVMTATPIPRTLSITLYGDLDLSTIRELPPGRHPVITKVVSSARSDEVYRYVAQRLDAGDQAYIVVPVIDETDSGLKDLRSHLRWLEGGPLTGKRIAAVHGRLKSDTRESIMHRFRRGDVQALVATTVIEVGVDVPNATIMVIEHADRFGLAQLHQLRGRVGRSSRKSLCVLIADPVTDDGKARVQAIAATNDGFVIAEKDLEIRGPGELFGSRQAGVAPFRVAELPRDAALLRMARRDAQKWIDDNPRLAGPRDALLKKRLLKLHGESFGLGDVA